MTEVVDTYIRNYTSTQRLVRNKFFWILFLLIGFSYPIYRSMNRVLPEPLPVLYPVPNFSMTNENGSMFGTDQLKGRIYLANFIFTSCATICPKMTKIMKTVQKRVRGLGNKIAIVSFSVDPEVDRPDILHKYARENKANPYIWNFLTTNTEAEMKLLLLKGFKVPVGEKEDYKGTELYEISHTEKIVLVDGEGNVRGYYSIDKNSINRLMIDVGLMVNRPGLI
jgi:protein SCO1/2